MKVAKLSRKTVNRPLLIDIVRGARASREATLLEIKKRALAGKILRAAERGKSTVHHYIDETWGGNINHKFSDLGRDLSAFVRSEGLSVSRSKDRPDVLIVTIPGV